MNAISWGGGGERKSHMTWWRDPREKVAESARFFWQPSLQLPGTFGGLSSARNIQLFLCSKPQSRQSARLFLQSSELGLPHPLPHRRVPPPPFWFGRGGGGTLARGRGGGKVPVPKRGQALWYSRYKSTLCSRHWLLTDNDVKCFLPFHPIYDDKLGLKND